MDTDEQLVEHYLCAPERSYTNASCVPMQQAACHYWTTAAGPRRHNGPDRDGSISISPDNILRSGRISSPARDRSIGCVVREGRPCATFVSLALPVWTLHGQSIATGRPVMLRSNKRRARFAGSCTCWSITARRWGGARPAWGGECARGQLRHRCRVRRLDRTQARRPRARVRHAHG